jgi:hypothetical protein
MVDFVGRSNILKIKSGNSIKYYISSSHICSIGKGKKQCEFRSFSGCDLNKNPINSICRFVDKLILFIFIEYSVAIHIDKAFYISKIQSLVQKFV